MEIAQGVWFYGTNWCVCLCVCVCVCVCVWTIHQSHKLLCRLCSTKHLCSLCEKRLFSEPLNSIQNTRHLLAHCNTTVTYIMGPAAFVG